MTYFREFLYAVKTWNAQVQSGLKSRGGSCASGRDLSLKEVFVLLNNVEFLHQSDKRAEVYINDNISTMFSRCKIYLQCFQDVACFTHQLFGSVETSKSRLFCIR